MHDAGRCADLVGLAQPLGVIGKAKLFERVCADEKLVVVRVYVCEVFRSVLALERSRAAPEREHDGAGLTVVDSALGAGAIIFALLAVEPAVAVMGLAAHLRALR